MSLIQDLFQKSQAVPDPRTGDWPLMKFEHAVSITLAYVTLVVIEKRIRILPKLDLYFVRIIHNFAMTAINFYLVVELLRQAAATSWYGPIVRDDRGTGVCFSPIK